MDAVTQAASNRSVEWSLIQAAFDAVPEGLVLIEDRLIVFANPAAARLLGYADPELLLGQPLARFVSQCLFCRDLLLAEPSSECEHPSCEATIQRADKQQLRAAIRCTRFDYEGRVLVLTAFHEARRSEIGRMLWAGEPRFRTIFEGAGIGIGTCTLDGRIIEINPAFSRMLGYTAAELIGMHASEFHPGDFQEDEALLKDMALGLRDSFDLEKRYRRKDGTYLWGHVTVSLVRDSEWRPTFVIAMLEDTTARRHAEERMREAEKMEVIGRLAGGIAHDFNNLLTGILLYCDLMLSTLRSDDPSRSHAEEIRIAGEHGAALTQQLLSIARKQAPQPRPVHLNDVISSTENLLRRLIGEQIELITVLDPGIGLALGDPGQIRQVVLNLALNARDALPDGGRITVSTHIQTMPGLEERAVSLRVSDNGCGMDASTRAHLFEPFFTTKKPGHGTGLGLSTVQRIVKEAGGVIEVKSELGHGTQIEVFLPAMKESAAVLPISAPKSGETILLVDDNSSARHSMQRVLHHAGFRVLPASNGKKAIQVFHEHKDTIDLLLADWMMPGMSGQELADLLRLQKPGLRVLLISGYQDSQDVPKNFSGDLIRKPFAGNALIEHIRTVLDIKGEMPC